MGLRPRQGNLWVVFKLFKYYAWLASNMAQLDENYSEISSQPNRIKDHISPKNGPEIKCLTLQHLEMPKLYTILAFLSAIGLKAYF